MTDLTDTNTPVIRRPAVAAAMALSFVVAFCYGWLLDIRFDEAFTLETTAHGVVHAFRQAIGFEQQAPLYFVLLSIWRMAGEGIFWARLFSVICAPLIVWAAAAAARRYLADEYTTSIAFVTALNTQVLWSADEIRPYALMLLLAALVLVTFYDAYLSDRTTVARRAAFAAVCIVSLYTQYYLGFLMAGCGIALLFAARGSIKRFAVDAVVIAIAFVPMALAVTGQVRTMAGHTESVFGGLPLIRAVYQMAAVLVLPVEWLGDSPVKTWAVRAILAALGLLFVQQLIRRRQREDVVLAVIAAVTILCFAAANYGLGELSIQKRHFAVVLLPLLFITFAAVRGIGSRVIAADWAILLIALNLVQTADANRYLAKPGDPRRAAEYVMANESPNEPVLVFHSDAVLAIRQYYRGQNELVPLPSANPFDTWDPRRNVIESEQQLAERIDALPGNAKRFWLVTDGWCFQGSLLFNCDTLETYVERNYRVIVERDLLEPTRVRLIERR